MGILSRPGRFLIFITLLFTLSDNAQAGFQPIPMVESEYSTPSQEMKKWKFLGLDVYWKEKLHLDSAKKKLRVRIGGRLMLDGGHIGANRSLSAAFPRLEGYDAEIRRLWLSAEGTIHNVVEFSIQVDLARLAEMKNIWLGVSKVPFFGHIRAGHFKEPFSLEELTTNKHLTFMERSLPTLAFAPGRDIGLMCRNGLPDGRMTWAGGAFLIVGSFGDVGELTDRLSDAFGYSLAGRLTGLPLYEREGRKLMHLGLSYSHQFRNDNRSKSQLRLSALPETFLTDVRLVDTAPFYTGGVDLINVEFAMVQDSLSLQGEYFHVLADASRVGNPDFWGFYVAGSWFLTGEHRNYDTKRAVFSNVKPRRNFKPFKDGGGWGGWEIALRYSYMDLSDKGIKGGKEQNITAGLNWYLCPFVRLMFNGILIRAWDRDTPPVDDGNANILQARFQVSF